MRCEKYVNEAMHAATLEAEQQVRINYAAGPVEVQGHRLVHTSNRTCMLFVQDAFRVCTHHFTRGNFSVFDRVSGADIMPILTFWT